MAIDESAATEFHCKTPTGAIITVKANSIIRSQAAAQAYVDKNLPPTTQEAMRYQMAMENERLAKAKLPDTSLASAEPEPNHPAPEVKP